MMLVSNERQQVPCFSKFCQCADCVWSVIIVLLIVFGINEMPATLFDNFFGFLNGYFNGHHRLPLNQFAGLETLPHKVFLRKQNVLLLLVLFLYLSIQHESHPCLEKVPSTQSNTVHNKTQKIHCTDWLQISKWRTVHNLLLSNFVSQQTHFSEAAPKLNLPILCSNVAIN